jgi:hypothetical protein
MVRRLRSQTYRSHLKDRILPAVAVESLCKQVDPSVSPMSRGPGTPCQIPHHSRTAFLASSCVSKTTIPVPLGLPSGNMATSARMIAPASRKRSFISCQVAVCGSCLDRRVRNGSGRTRGFSLAYVPDKQLPVIGRRSCSRTAEASSHSPTYGTSLAESRPNLTRDGHGAESSLGFSVLRQNRESVQFGWHPDAISDKSSRHTSRMKTGRPKSIRSPSPFMARSADSWSTYSTILRGENPFIC